MSEERTFIVHPDGTDEIYNLQIVEESEFPEFFRQFMFEEEPADSHWTDAADRWRFFDATNMSDDRIQEIVESHNEKAERVLERADFQWFERTGVTASR